MCPLKNNTGFQYHLLSIPRVTSQGASNKVVNNYNIFNYNGGSSCYGNWLFGANYGCGCGCGFGGFNWSSFGNCFKAGLGFGLANLATGLIGCGFNWLMGGITTGNWRLGDYFGMGGYGMDGHGAGGYGYNNYGNSWIYGADNSRSKGNEKVKTETKEDQDSQRLVNLDKEVSTMEATFKKNPEAVTIERFTDLYNAVSKKADTDDICKNANEDLKKLLLGRLKNIAKDKGWTVDDEGKVTDPKAAPKDQAQTGPGVGQTQENQGAGHAQTGQGVGQTPEDGIEDQQKIINATSVDDLINDVEYDELTTSDKETYEQKAKELLDGENVTGDNLNDEINKLPDNARQAVRKLYQDIDCTNVTASELNNDIKVKLAHDAGEPDDIENDSSNEAKLTVNSDKTAVTLKTASGIGVTYTRVDNVTEEAYDGEIIFESSRDNQLYVLQKNNSGEYVLNQYKYHKGYNVPDVHNN